MFISSQEVEVKLHLPFLVYIDIEMDEYDNSILGQDRNLNPLTLDPADHQLSQSDPYLFSIHTRIIT